jgi:hypothetical protein
MQTGNPDKSMIVLENSVYPQQDVHIPCSHNEACASSSPSGDQTVNIKVEELSHVQDGEVPATLEIIKAEHEVSCMSVSTVGHISDIQNFLFPFSSTSIMENVFSLQSDEFTKAFIDKAQVDSFLYIAYAVRLSFCVKEIYMKQNLSLGFV